jgi:hypothetical protein
VYIFGLRLNLYIASALAVFGAIWFYRSQRRPEPAGAVPAGAMPAGAMPAGAVPAGAGAEAAVAAGDPGDGPAETQDVEPQAAGSEAQESRDSEPTTP